VPVVAVYGTCSHVAEDGTLHGSGRRKMKFTSWRNGDD